jgi:hypothetical protein
MKAAMKWEEVVVSSFMAGSMVAACSNGGADSGPISHAGSSGIAGVAAGGEPSGKSGTGGVGETGGASGAAGRGGAAGTGGAGGTGGAAGTAGGSAETRWLDPGEGIGCGSINSTECDGLPVWGCAAVAPTNPSCQPVSPKRYCCGEATCLRSSPQDDTFCPGPLLMINCVADAPAPARCSPYGTDKNVWCCEP